MDSDFGDAPVLGVVLVMGLLLGAAIMSVVSSGESQNDFRATYCDTNSGDCVSFDLDKRVLELTQVANDQERRLVQLENYIIALDQAIAQQAQEAQIQGGN